MAEAGEQRKVTGMKTPKIIVAGFAQESNSFTGIPTRLEDFVGRGSELLRGEEILHGHRGVNSVMGGFLEDLESSGVEVIPLLHAHACPGGPLTREAFESIRDELLEAVAATREFDAVLLFLHGAMVADGYDDPEGDFLTRLRKLVGDRLIGVVLDLHANVTSAMIQATDVTVGFKTYPHVDMAERGRQAASTIRELLQDQSVLHSAFIEIPMLLPSIRMRTIDSDGPYTRMQERARLAAAADSGIAEVGMYAGFPYGDVPSHRASVVVFHRDSEEAAGAIARQLAGEYWDTRSEFLHVPEPAESAVDRAFRATAQPVVLADIADNPGSGGTGETTGLLRILLERNVPATFVGIIHDPETTAHAFELGEGVQGDFVVGGKIEPAYGAPAGIQAQVVLLSDGDYVCKGPMNHGKLEHLGRTALLKHDNVLIAVTEGRSSVNDPAMIEMLGLDIQDLRVMSLKVKGHFRAAFGSLVAEVIDAEAPGASMTDFTEHAFTRRHQPAFPFELDTDFQP